MKKKSYMWFDDVSANAIGYFDSEEEAKRTLLECTQDELKDSVLFEYENDVLLRAVLPSEFLAE